jgi:Methyltransferase FkbM domain
VQLLQLPAMSLRDAALRIPRLRRIVEEREALRAERDRLAARLAVQNGGNTLDAGSPFLHYNASFDPQEVLLRHAVPDVQGTPGYLTNFLGVRLDPKFFPNILSGRAGEVEAIPIPANWHADMAEWGAALRAVDLARGVFTVVELGCGWGCWLNNTGAAARRAGLEVHLIGVEGDAGHVKFAEEAYAANGFSPQQVTLHRGIAAAVKGVALFPRQQQAGVQWGLEPILGATEQQRRRAVQSGSHDELPMIALQDIAAPHRRIDLLHIDIQGGEADFIAGCLPVLVSKIAYIVIGTHSRQIEGRIMATLLDAGWRLEIERPAIISLSGAVPLVTVDGVQGWRNPRLT